MAILGYTLKIKVSLAIMGCEVTGKGYIPSIYYNCISPEYKYMLTAIGTVGIISM